MEMHFFWRKIRPFQVILDEPRYFKYFKCNCDTKSPLGAPTSHRNLKFQARLSRKIVTSTFGLCFLQVEPLVLQTSAGCLDIATPTTRILLTKKTVYDGSVYDEGPCKKGDVLKFYKYCFDEATT